MRFCVKFREQQNNIRLRAFAERCGDLRPPERFKIDFSKKEQSFAVNLGEVQIVPIGSASEIFMGPYLAVPDWTEQEFRTKDKTMADNFRVNAIPTYEVSNNAGGVTIMIGGI